MAENNDFFPETKANNIFEKNLDNIKKENNLWGTRDLLSMKSRIGFLPISIWEPDWMITTELKKVIGDDGSSRNLVGNKMQLMGSKYSTSIFNPHLAQMILSAYCPVNANIYDPFAGGGTRGFIAAAMGHKYSGVEIREEEVNRIINQQEKLKKYFVIQHGDSRNIYFKESSFDFSYTCPPYYNLEVYSYLPDDLSGQPTYEIFLSKLKDCILTTYKLLKKESLSIWVVGNFRDKYGYLTHFSGDVIKLAQQVGFKLHDELIFWGASKCASQRCGQFEANRKSVRVHEYIVILKKPND